MSVCGHTRAPMEHVILFCLQGTLFLKCGSMKRFRRCADTRWHTTYTLGEEHARSVLEGMECIHWEPFSLGKAPLSFVPFLERIGAIICPPRLGSSRCWGSEETELEAIRSWSLLTSLREEFFILRSSAADEIKCGRKMYCLLHILIQQEVLCWLMWADEGGEDISEPSQLVCPAM